MPPTIRPNRSPSELSADQFSFTTFLRRNRRAIGLIAISAAAYLIGLVATMPAAIGWPGPDRDRVAGTIWHGQIALANGHRLIWRWAPLSSLVSLSAAADLVIDGDETNLSGRAMMRPGTIRIEDLSGFAGGGLLRALAPSLPFRCETTMRVDLKRAAFGAAGYRIDGRAWSQPGYCQMNGDTGRTAIDAMVATFVSNDAGSIGTLTPRGRQRLRLLDARLSPEGALRIDVSAAGAARLPFVAPNGQSSLETQL